MLKKLIVLVLLFFVSTTYAFVEECRPVGGCCSPFVVGIDWLYWRLTQDGLEYASQVSLTQNPSIATSHILFPAFTAQSGFRVFAEYELCNGIGVGGNFVHLCSQAENRTNVDPANTVNNFIALNSLSFPVFIAVNSQDPAILLYGLDASLDTNFNYLDLDLTYRFCVARCLTITPNMGLRGMWIRQTFELEGRATNAFLTSKFVENFSGYGLEGGITVDLALGCGFSLTGSLGGSILYARVDVTEALDLFATDSLNIRYAEDYNHSSPTFNTFLGLNYHSSIFCYPCELHVGWEQHVIANANHYTILGFRDITMQGLTLGGSITF